MKESERLKKELESHDSPVPAGRDDYSILHLERKIQRAKREETFVEKWLVKLRENCDVEEISRRGCFRITTAKFGKSEKIDFYPRANRLRFHNSNRWYSSGLGWIIKNLIKS